LIKLKACCECCDASREASYGKKNRSDGQDRTSQFQKSPSRVVSRLTRRNGGFAGYRSKPG
jgi:hypothetical protein